MVEQASSRLSLASVVMAGSSRYGDNGMAMGRDMPQVPKKPSQMNNALVWALVWRPATHPLLYSGDYGSSLALAAGVSSLPL